MKKVIPVKLLTMNILLLSILFFYGSVPACTSAIISAKASADGRPIMWKHRDSDSEENKLMHFKGSKYDFTGVVNTQDVAGKEIWMGSNTSGFSIMNTASYNLNEGEKINIPDDQEGMFMKAALGECSTVEEFESFLKNQKGKWGIAANFGVIDAKGGAAYFETGYYTYVKYDVNDPAVAPDGYLIRTNYSFSGVKLKGYGYVRYETMKELFSNAHERNDLSVKFLLKEADRCLKNSLLKTDLYHEKLPEDSSSAKYILFRDYVVRNSSVSTMIIQGVKPEEDARFTTMWTVLGFPLTTLVVPVWAATGDTLPDVMVSHDGKTAPINEKSLMLKKKCFPMEFDNGKDYLNLAAILTSKGHGIVQRLFPKENEIIRTTLYQLEVWRNVGYDEKSAVDQYKWTDKYIRDTYKDFFGL